MVCFVKIISLASWIGLMITYDLLSTMFINVIINHVCHTFIVFVLYVFSISYLNFSEKENQFPVFQWLYDGIIWLDETLHLNIKKILCVSFAFDIIIDMSVNVQTL